MNDFFINLQAKLNETKSRISLNKDIAKLQSKLDKVKLQAEIDPEIISELTKEQEVVINPKIELADAEKEQEQLASGFDQISKRWDKLGEKSQDKLLKNFFGDSQSQISSAIKLFDVLRESAKAMENTDGSGGWMKSLGIMVEKIGASDLFKNIGKDRISVRISKPINC